jgi:outer membrane biosynthesis protein TonB
MLRLLIFLLWVVFAAFLVTLALTFGESVKIEAFGWRMDAPAGVAGAGLALLLGATALIVSLWKDWTGMRRRALLRAVLKRREKGVAAFVEAVEAHQAGDDRRTHKLATKAAKLLDRDAIAGLFRRPPETMKEEPAPEKAAPEEPAPAEIAAPEPQPAPSPEPQIPPQPATPVLPPPTDEATLPPPDAVDADKAFERDIAAARRVN